MPDRPSASIRPCHHGQVTAEALSDQSGVDFCYVTTRGRVTGRPHTIEIWFGSDGNTLYLLSGGGDRADWVRNLRATPSATVRIGDREWGATARLAIRGDEADRARRLLAGKYQGWREGRPLSRWAATALPVAFDLA